MTDESPNALDETAANIAQQLGETDLIPQEQIQRIVERLGAKATLAFLRGTLEIEAQGGILLPTATAGARPVGSFSTSCALAPPGRIEHLFGLLVHHLCHHRAQKSRLLRRLHGKIASRCWMRSSSRKELQQQ
jgi:hypothetical protein